MHLAPRVALPPSFNRLPFSSVGSLLRLFALALLLGAGLTGPASAANSAWQPVAGFHSNPERRAGVGTVALASGDGNFFVGGDFSSWNGEPHYSLVKVDATGQPVAGFEPPEIPYWVGCLALQSDGKLFVGGYFGLMRLNADGSLDSTFATSGFHPARALAVQADGKIVVMSDLGLKRLTAQGAVDPTFQQGSGFDHYVHAIALQPDGYIIAAGQFSSYNGVACGRIVRLLPNGTLDPTFASGAGFDDQVSALAAYSDGRLLAAGSFTTYAGTARRYAARLLADGTLDPTFDASASVKAATRSVSLDGTHIYFGGGNTLSATKGNPLVRLEADGSADLAFENNFPALSVSGAVLSIAISSESKVFLAGSFGGGGSLDLNATYSGAVAVTRTGSPVANFSALVCLPGAVSVVQSAPEGKFLIGGAFTHVNGSPVPQLFTRLHADGSPDLTFNAGGEGARGGSVAQILVQADGKILIGGVFSTYNGVTRTNLARVLADGSLDLTFNPNSAMTGAYAGETLAVQSDGKILVGSFSQTATSTVGFFRRLNPDGSLDATFAGNALFTGSDSSAIKCIAVDASDRIYVGGIFALFDATMHFNLVRLLPNGAIDPTFDASGLNYYPVRTFLLRPNNRLWVGTYANGPIELLENGTLNPSFYTGSAELTEKFVPRPDGKVFALGFGGWLELRDSDGRLSSPFQTRGIDYLSVADVLPLPDNSVLVAGNLSWFAAGTSTLMRLADQPLAGAPVFTTHPASVRTAPGSTATFSVTATGTPAPTYRWLISLDQGTTWTNLSDNSTYAGTTLATLTVQVDATLASRHYRCVATNTGGTTASNAALLTFSDDFTLWQTAYFTAEELRLPALTGADGIRSADGLTNLMKYALGLAPQVPATAAELPTTRTTATNWEFTYQRPADTADLTYTVEISTDLLTWTTSGVTHEKTGDTGDTQTWTARHALANTPTLFFRLKVTR